MIKTVLGESPDIYTAGLFSGIALASRVLSKTKVVGEEFPSPSLTTENQGNMAKAKYLGLASAAELAIAMTLGADTHAQVAGPSPSLNLPGATEQGVPLPQIIVTGYIIPRVGEGPQPVTTLDRPLFVVRLSPF